MRAGLLRTVVALGIAFAWPAGALAQDAGAMRTLDASTLSSGDAARPAAAAPHGCQSDTAPVGHEARVVTAITPERPSVGDRVLITYQLYSRGGDSIEFEPDPAAFVQPSNEMEYAREQPDRDRRIHAGPSGQVYGEVQVAVQPFKTGDMVIAPQLARLNAAGDVIRVCTPEVRFRVHDPFGNDPHPSPRDTTPPEVVTEDALRSRIIALVLDALFVVVVSTLLISAYLRSRPKPIVPPPPPRPAWIVAIEALDAIAHSDLLSRGLTKDYYDAISDVVRRYVGASRGFDALEMTTDEVLSRMRRTPLAGVTSTEVEHLLRECDLVKFARYVPTHEESEGILTQGYGIVRRSSPITVGPSATASAEATSDSTRGAR